MVEFNRKQFLLELNKAKRLSTEEFVERGKKLYGNSFRFYRKPKTLSFIY